MYIVSYYINWVNSSNVCSRSIVKFSCYAPIYTTNKATVFPRSLDLIYIVTYYMGHYYLDTKYELNVYD